MDVEVTPDALGELLDQMRRLQAAFDAKIRYDETRERLVESMSQELAVHREQQTQRQVRTILVDLVAMHDDLNRLAAAPDCAPETARTLEYFRDLVEQTLARSGVEPFTVEGDEVDRGQQRIVGTVPTTDPAADRTVAQRLRAGFRWHDQTLRPEWVTAQRYTPEEPPATEPEGDRS